jgi:hypothetical protein
MGKNKDERVKRKKIEKLTVPASALASTSHGKAPVCTAFQLKF